MEKDATTPQVVERYKLHAEETVRQLEIRVSTDIAQGWRPCGGVAVLLTDGLEGSAESGVIYAQAMVRE